MSPFKLHSASIMISAKPKKDRLDMDPIFVERRRRVTRVLSLAIHRTQIATREPKWSPSEPASEGVKGDEIAKREPLRAMRLITFWRRRRGRESNRNTYLPSLLPSCVWLSRMDDTSPSTVTAEPFRQKFAHGRGEEGGGGAEMAV